MTRITQLSNGLVVVLERMDAVRSASVGIYVKAGSAYENRENNGISHVMEHMLFKGTRTKSAGELANEMASIGGEINAYTAKEETCYYVKVLDEYLMRVLALMGDMLVNSVVDEKELRKELGVILDEIDMYNDSPEDQIEEDVAFSSWGNHPLGFAISGEKETVSQFGREQVLSYLKDSYTAERIVITVAGSFEEEAVLELLEQHFGRISAKGREAVLNRPEFTPKFHVIHKEIEQIHICLAYEGVSRNDKDKYSFSILNNIIGGSVNSRLFQKIREEEGLVYAIESYVSMHNLTGMFEIYAASGTEEVREVLSQIGEIMEQVRTMGITEEELRVTKDQIRAELLIGQESTSCRMSSNGKNLLFLGRLVSVEETIQGLFAVEQEDLHQFIEKYWSKGSCSLSVIGDTRSFDAAKMEQLWAEIF